MFNIKASALTYGGCAYSDVARLKAFVSNINISYDYYIQNNKAYFNIKLTNIVPGIYFEDSQTGNKYSYENTNNGEIVIYNYTNTNGNYKFYSSLNECYGVKLGNKYYTLPTYNIYYEDVLCKENPNHSLCQKWIKMNYSYDEFKGIIDKYNLEKDDTTLENEKDVIYEKTYLNLLVDFYIDYYYIILLSIIAICVVIMIINTKKNKFDI